MVNLDLPLDDIIKQKKGAQRGKQRGGKANPGGEGRVAKRGRTGRRGSGSGPAGGQQQRTPHKATPAKRPPAIPAIQPAAPISGGLETGHGIIVSNLDPRVTEEDLVDLFSANGVVKRATLSFNRDGRPQGTAQVVFQDRKDALAAFERYNGVALDGRPMNIEVLAVSNIGAPITPAKAAPRAPASGPQPSKRAGARAVGTGGVQKRGASNAGGRGAANKGPAAKGGRQAGGRNGAGKPAAPGGGKRGQGKKGGPKSAQELDAELDAFVSSRAPAAAASADE